MAISTIPLYTGDIPDRNTQDAATFTINAIDWLDYQEIQIPATNTTVNGINLAVADIDADVIAAAASAAASAASAASANISDISSQSNANFKGRWSDATGAATIPATYSNNGQTWQLLQNIADITADEPMAGASNWQVVNDINLSNVRVSELDNPTAHLLKKNKFVETLKGNVSSTRNTIATRVGINGIVRDVAVDDPREEETGWLFEGVSDDNLILRSEEFDDAAWIKSGDVTVSDDSTAAPDEATTADKLTSADWSIGSNHARQTTPNRPLGNQTYSVFAKKDDLSTMQLRTIFDNSPVVDGSSTFNFDSGTFTDISSSHTVSVKSLTNGWWRLSVTIDITDAGFGSDLRLGGGSSEVAGSIFVWGAQLEDSPFATSYIKTTTAALPRSADNQSFPSAENFRESEGCIFLKADVIGDTGGVQVLLEVSDGSSNNRLLLRRTSDKIQLIIVTSSVVLVDISTVFNMEPSVQYQIAINYKDNDVELFVDCVSVGTDTSVILPRGLTISSIGSATSGPELFGHIQDLRFYPIQLNLDEIKYLGGQ